MHILILPMYYPEPGAPPHRGYMFYEQAMQIARSGCRVALAYTEQRATREFGWRTFRKENHFQITEEDNGTFLTLRLHAWNPKLSTHIGGLIWSLLTLLLVRRYIRRHGRPDVIHAHFGLWAGYAASLIGKCYGIPYVVTEHASSINGGQVTRRQATIVQKAYQGARKVICVGTLLKKNISPRFVAPEKCTVIPNFVDTSTFVRKEEKPTAREKQFTFASIGNLTQRKGFAELLEAFGRSFGTLPHVKLVIAGDGEEEARLHEQIERLGLTGQVTLAGRLSREEVAQLLTQCDAFVLASFAETFGIVFIEAMAAGLPCIGTVCGGPEDIITPESGYLVRPGDVDALAEKMRLLHDNYQQFDRERIRQAVIRRFDFRTAGEKLTEIYKQALQP